MVKVCLQEAGARENRLGPGSVLYIDLYGGYMC